MKFVNNLPFIDTSLLNTALPKISILLFIDKSLEIYRREFIDTSPLIKRRGFNDTSLPNVAVPKTPKNYLTSCL